MFLYRVQCKDSCGTSGPHPGPWWFSCFLLDFQTASFAGTVISRLRFILLKNTAAMCQNFFLNQDMLKLRVWWSLISCQSFLHTFQVLFSFSCKKFPRTIYISISQIFYAFVEHAGKPHLDRHVCVGGFMAHFDNMTTSPMAKFTQRFQIIDVHMLLLKCMSVQT